MAYPLLTTLCIGIFVRILLASSSVAEWLAERNEISTPLTAWKRVTEGLELYRLGVSPYSGDILHESPLLLRLLGYLSTIMGRSVYLVFVLLDVVTALMLERTAKHCSRWLLFKQARDVKQYSPDAQSLMLKANHLHWSRFLLVAAYLLNPYTIASCLAKSTAVFTNLTVVLVMLHTLKGSSYRSSACIALAAYLSLYPIMLVVPTALFLLQREEGTDSFTNAIALRSYVSTVSKTLFMLATLLYVSYLIEGSWDFVHATYGFTLLASDLTPNVGIFWYFFTEMFEHFRLFFLCVFQLNVFVYVVPLTILLRRHPIFLMHMIMALIAIFKSYPSYADAALYLAMLPLWRHVYPYMRNTFLVSCMMVTCAFLAPVLWHLWIYAGAANANFYFAITLVYSTSQIFLITDLLFGFLRREYELLNGTKFKLEDGRQGQVILD